jgi:hypothetical protein
MGAWWLAKRTNRTLVVDWRGSRFNPDKSFGKNCFFKFFQRRERLAGVEVLADDECLEIEYPIPIWPDKWSSELLKLALHVPHTFTEISQVNSLITSDANPSAPTVVLNQWIDPLPPGNAIAELFEDLQMKPGITEAADRFWLNHVGSSRAIAIHIRHGNGENIGARAAYWLGPFQLCQQLLLNAGNDVHAPGTSGRFDDNMPQSLVDGYNQVRRFCSKFAKSYGAFLQSTGLQHGVPILFTDAKIVIDAMREVIPNIVVPEKSMRLDGRGPLHQKSEGVVSEQATREMLVDLELMNRCSALAFMDSGFSIMLRTRLSEDVQLRIRPFFLNRLIVRTFPSKWPF